MYIRSDVFFMEARDSRYAAMSGNRRLLAICTATSCRLLPGLAAICCQDQLSHAVILTLDVVAVISEGQPSVEHSNTRLDFSHKFLEN